MRVISRRALRDFWEIHPQAKAPLCAWCRIVEHGSFSDFNTLKATFGAADYVAPYTLFNVGGNRFRVVAVIHYDRRRIYIRHVFTHADYDRWSDELRKGRGRGKQ
jgi:mRNA interferase HigB